MSIKTEALRFEVPSTFEQLRPCPACGSDKGYGHGQIFDVVNCADCGTMFVISAPHTRSPVIRRVYDALAAVGIKSD